MPPSHPAPDFIAKPGPVSNDGARLVFDLSRVLVIGRSPITCVVVAKIAERSGLKPFTEQPEKAADKLASLTPGLVIIDGGVENRDCDQLMPALSGTRRAAGGSLPVTILLSNANASGDRSGFGGMIDAVVAKPITPENLQPVIERLLRVTRA